MKTLLKEIYGRSDGEMAFERLQGLIENTPIKSEKYQDRFSEQDIVLITYGDSIKSRSGSTPLQTLFQFCRTHFKDIFSTIHILPFFPYSSDDGFSVKDFYSVDESLGSWEDILENSQDFKLMYDFVLNHISAESEWFKAYLAGQEGFKDLAVEVDPNCDLSLVTRPRSLPLLTKFRKKDNTDTHVWTTFSEDQIDINYESVSILIKFIEILLFYVSQGAKILRLDAIAYLWKQIGTNCIHLPHTHNVVKLFRKVLDQVAPEVMILTETNVPHEENISYFGNGHDEAQMVYNFTLPPLLLYSFIKQDITQFGDWAETLDISSPTNTLFNFTASHDGIGVRPLEGILSGSELDRIISMVKENGGRVSLKKNPDGSESPYELNITYVDAYLRRDDESEESHANRFLASQAIQLVLPGVPAIYIHSILGTHNWEDGVQQSKRARTINRQKLFIEDIEPQLSDPDHFRSRIFHSYLDMIRCRVNQPAFHPNASFEIIKLHPQVFGIKRCCDSQEIIALTNISSQTIDVEFNSNHSPGASTDLLTKTVLHDKEINLKPYQSIWLEKKD